MMRCPLDVNIFNRVKKILEMGEFTMLLGYVLIGKDLDTGSTSFALVEDDDIKAQTARFVLADCPQFPPCGASGTSNSAINPTCMRCLLLNAQLLRLIGRLLTLYQRSTSIWWCSEAGCPLRVIPGHSLPFRAMSVMR